jgi:hypothetical protein
MKRAFFLVAFTAATVCFAIFLTTLPGGRLLGLSPANTAAVRASDNGCRLQGPLFADGRSGRNLLFRLSEV